MDNVVSLKELTKRYSLKEIVRAANKKFTLDLEDIESLMYLVNKFWILRIMLVIETS